jgi:Leucine-rich repeat (LRR) protein
MSNDSDPKESDLVPAGNKALTTRSSALVRRGLETLAAQQPRIVRFPPDHSVGQYLIFDTDAVPPAAEVCSWLGGSSSSADHKIEEAKGAITLPPGKVLCLKVNNSAAKDLSSLSRLNPQDVHTLVVDLSSTRVSNEELKYTQSLSNLHRLFLRGTNISDDGLEYLQNMRKLEFLDLFGTDVSDEGMNYLQRLSNLSWLSLGRTQVGDEGMKYLQTLSTMWFLSLRFSKISDKGLKYIQKLSNLSWVTLRGTDISDDGLQYLQSLSKLKILDLRETKVTDKGLDQIKQALPSCTLNWDIV